MIKRIKHKIHRLRQEPEEVRMRAVTRFTVIGGVVVFILWLVVFLPLQLRSRKQPSEPGPEEVLQQVISGQEATPTPAPTLLPRSTSETPIIPSVATPSPAVQGLQFLPASEDRLTATPTP